MLMIRCRCLLSSDISITTDGNQFDHLSIHFCDNSVLYTDVVCKNLYRVYLGLTFDDNMI